MEGKTSTSLDDHSQTWLNLILCMAQPIFSKKIKKLKKKKTRWQTKGQIVQHMVEQ